MNASCRQLRLLLLHKFCLDRKATGAASNFSAPILQWKYGVWAAHDFSLLKIRCQSNDMKIDAFRFESKNTWLYLVDASYLYKTWRKQTYGKM